MKDIEAFSLPLKWYIVISQILPRVKLLNLEVADCKILLRKWAPLELLLSIFQRVEIYSNKQFTIQVSGEVSKDQYSKTFILLRLVVWLLSHVRLCNSMESSSPGLPAPSVSQTLPKFMSIESVMLSNHLIYSALRHPCI